MTPLKNARQIVQEKKWQQMSEHKRKTAEKRRRFMAAEATASDDNDDDDGGSGGGGVHNLNHNRDESIQHRGDHDELVSSSPSFNGDAICLRDGKCARGDGDEEQIEHPGGEGDKTMGQPGGQGDTKVIGQSNVDEIAGEGLANEAQKEALECQMAQRNQPLANQNRGPSVASTSRHVTLDQSRAGRHTGKQEVDHFSPRSPSTGGLPSTSLGCHPYSAQEQSSSKGYQQPVEEDNRPSVVSDNPVVFSLSFQCNYCYYMLLHVIVISVVPFHMFIACMDFNNSNISQL